MSYGFLKISLNFSHYKIILSTTMTTHIFIFYFNLFTEEVALLWGKEFYSNELLQADEYSFGSVSTEILLQKDSGSFTLSNGWAFPRRIYFNGENCMMPLPDNFPMLPNTSPARISNCRHFILIIALLALIWIRLD